MENLFNLFSDNLKNRYVTLLNNLKYKSNSFYDAYNSLIEEYLREVAKNELNLTNLKGSIHDLLNNPKINNYFLEVLGLTNTKYKKMLDYAYKLNQHKHRHEHSISLESALDYMELMYDFVYAYTSFKGYTIPNYDSEFITKLYGSGIINDNNIYSKILAIENKVDSICESNVVDENTQKAANDTLKINTKINELRLKGKRLLAFSYPLKDMKSDKLRMAITYGIIIFTNLCLIFAGAYFALEKSLAWIIGSLVFVIYYTFKAIRLLRFKEMIEIKEFRRVNICDTVRLDDGNYVPVKMKTISSFLVPFIFAFYILMFIGYLGDILTNNLLGNLLVIFLALGAVLSFTFRRFSYYFLLKYENIYFYDDEASVMFSPYLNQFIDFKYKK